MKLQNSVKQYEVLKRKYDEYQTEYIRRSKLKGKPFRIAFCGVFSSGKSSLINALLGYDYLPTGINPITKIVTRIRYGPKLNYYCISNNGRMMNISEKEMRQIVQGKAQLPNGFSELLAEIPSDLLNRKIEIIDTPGYQDEVSLERITRNTVNKSDMAVMCCNALQLGNMFEKEYLEELSKTTSCICLIVNRSDKLNENEYVDVQKQAERLISRYINNIAVNCFFTASCGSHKNLNGFDNYLTSILNSTEKLSQIRKKTNELYLENQRTKLLNDALKLQEELSKDRAFLLNLIEKGQKEADLKNAIITQSLNMRIEKMMLEADAIIKDYEKNIKNKIEKADKEFGVEGFVENASKEVRKEINDLINNIAVYAENEALGDADKIAEIISPMSIDGYNVPKPKPHKERVKEFGVIGRTIFTAMNFITLDFTIDDGTIEKTVYNDYVKAAVNSVKRKLIKPIKVNFNNYINEVWKQNELKKNPLITYDIPVKFFEIQNALGELQAILSTLNIEYEGS